MSKHHLKSFHTFETSCMSQTTFTLNQQGQSEHQKRSSTKIHNFIYLLLIICFDLLLFLNFAFVLSPSERGEEKKNQQQQKQKHIQSTQTLSNTVLSRPKLKEADQN